MRVALQTSIIIALLLITGRQVRAQDTNQVPQKVRLEMDLVDGTRLMGSPELELVSLQTVYAKIDIPLNQIFSISIGEDC